MGFPYSHAAKDPEAAGKAGEFLDLYILSGARWDRRDFWWSVAEPEPGTWEWETFDRAIDDFREDNISAVVILCYGSAWKGHAPETAEEIAAFGEYAFQLVSRYKEHVRHWEVWNEPNILPFWSPKPDPVVYTQLLREAHRRIKEADPEAVVIAGALAGADDRFLRAMFENGAAGHFDALSYHTYGNNPTAEGQRHEVEALREVMEEYNHVRPLWLTETGIYTGPAGVGDQIQAERIVKSSVRWVALGMERVFQLTLKDWTDDPRTEDATSFRGLARMNGTPKPSFAAHRTMVEQLGNAAFVAQVRPDPAVDGYVFRQRDEARALVGVFWSKEGESVTVELETGAAHVTVTRMNGEWAVRRTRDGVLGMTITQEPVYVTGLDGAWNDVGGITIRHDPAPAGVIVTTRVEGGTTGLDARASLRLMPGPEYEIAPNNDGQQSLTLRPGTPSGTVYTRWRIGNLRHADTLDFFVPLQVVEPIELRFEPLQDLQLHNPTLQICLTNRRDTTATGALRWASIPDLVFGSVPSLSLSEREERRFAIDLPLGPDSYAGPVGLEAIYTIEGTEVVTTETLRLMPVPRVGTPPTIDGDLSEHTGREPNLAPRLFAEVDFNPARTEGPDDLALRGWLAYDEDALYLAVEARDDALHFPASNVVWNHDSLQVAIDGQNDARPGETFDGNDFEIQVARLRDGSDLVYATQYPEGFIASVVEDRTDLAIAVDEEAGTIRYEMRLPAAVLPGVELRPGRVLGISLIHNDNDGGGEYDREGWVELTPGIGYGKEPGYYYDAILLGD